jgi:hypothetical protein
MMDAGQWYTYPCDAMLYIYPYICQFGERFSFCLWLLFLLLLPSLLVAFGRRHHYFHHISSLMSLAFSAVTILVGLFVGLKVHKCPFFGRFSLQVPLKILSEKFLFVLF